MTELLDHNPQAPNHDLTHTAEFWLREQRTLLAESCTWPSDAPTQ